MEYNEVIPISKGSVYAFGTIENADGTAYVSVVPKADASTNVNTEDRHIIGIYIKSDDSASHDVELAINDGTNDHHLDLINVPANAGTSSGVNTVDGLKNFSQPVENAGNIYIPVPNAHTIKAKVISTAVSSGKTIQITLIMAKFTA